MANIDLIKRLNENYGKQSVIRSALSLKEIDEGFDPDNLKKSLPNSIASMGPSYAMCFEYGLSANVALLFIDVCGFSIRQADLDGDEIGEYFDSYYNIVIPLIYKYGGEVDKIIGDGIICVFGPPFCNADDKENIIKAKQCAKDIIKATKGTEHESKVALHFGNINYFKNKTGLYKEFTMIGKPLTELFRLESISIDNCINYFANTPVRTHCREIISSRKSAIPAKWTHSSHDINGLTGVSYKKFYSIKYNGD